MKKIKKLGLNKKNLVKLQNEEMSNLLGGNEAIDLSSETIVIDSVNTHFTMKSCCGGNCHIRTCRATEIRRR